MADVTLKAGATSALIATDGAWVKELTDENGEVLFSKTVLTNAAGEKKNRGGAHVCMPNFGPGGASGLQQHGFGRDIEWEVVDDDSPSTTLSMRGILDYEDMSATITYVLDDHKLVTTLEIKNNAGDALKVAPGFHPYFKTDLNEMSIELNGENYALDTLDPARFFETNRVMARINNRELTIVGENLNVFTLWSDRLDDYVCVEPTYGGFSFTEQAIRPAIDLQAGETLTCSYSISW